MSIDAILNRIDAELPASMDRLMELLRIPSISTDPAFKSDVDKAADWLTNELQELGIAAEKRPTTGHPMVVGHVEGDGPHLLFYGHYDVQPVDPLELWSRDPFDPALEETPNGTVIRGRGSSALSQTVSQIRSRNASSGKPHSAHVALSGPALAPQW